MRKLSSSLIVLGALIIAMGITTRALAAPGGKVRFVDNGDGTISDKVTGLMWEMKISQIDPGGNCADSTIAYRSTRCVNTDYKWTSTGLAADGTLFTDFLARMNCLISENGTCPNSLAGHSDWRIPTIAELMTILDLTASNCGSLGACINANFGVTYVGGYWSSTNHGLAAGDAWAVDFSSGIVATVPKGNGFPARAVRGGR